jgi:hypothetical protein
MLKSTFEHSIKIPVRKLLFTFSTLVVLASCETVEPTDTNTERFYRSGWNVELHREHGAVGALSAANQDMSTTANLDKSGRFTLASNALNDHMYQSWGYSWSTDQFFMNWEPCLEWFINEAEDSMYLKYNHYDYDPNSGNSFYWLYELEMTR